MNFNKLLLIIIFIANRGICYIRAEINDSIKNWGVQFTANPALIPTMDAEIREIIHNHNVFTAGMQFRKVSTPEQQDPFAHDFGYPTFAIGINYNFYNNIKFHRQDGPSLGMGKAVDYFSTLGNSISAYASFERPLLRNNRWEVDYAFNIGVGYSRLKYNPENQVDNLMIGSNVLIYFGAGMHATYRIHHDWGIKAGIDFNHHSSGTLGRPNKGSNAIGPMLALVYYPYYQKLLDKDKFNNSQEFKQTKYLNFSVDIGLKTLYEDWVQTQFNTPPGEKDYRTDDFKYYTVYTLKADYMKRYARRWASGFGIDLYYLSYMDHVRKMDHHNGYSDKHSPISIGFSGKHEVFYHNLSLAMSLGVYLFKQHGHKAKNVEQPFYETIGLKYHIPELNGLALGAFVRAHAFKADQTGISISYPLQLK